MPQPVDEKIPPFEEFKAPWEVNSDGKEIPEDEQEVDRSIFKKLLYNLRKDKARSAQAQREAESERDALKEKVAEKDREGESDMDALKREISELRAQPKNDPAKDAENLRLRAALKAGLPEEHIKRLDPELTDFDDIVEDAKSLMASFGGGKGTSTDEDDEDSPRGRARQARTSADPAGGRRTNEVSVDDLLQSVPSSSGFRI